jgi:hypothetical protein
MKSNFVLLFIFFLLLIVSSKAGTKLDFKTVDMLTYRCFEEKKWDSVIVVGKQALKQGIDYYYLRVRMGISYFEKRKYIPAITHLNKAIGFNSGDPVIIDYLYRSYLYEDCTEEAQLILDKKPKDKNDSPNTRNKVIEQVNFEGGLSLSNDKTSLQLPPHWLQGVKFGVQEIYGVDDLYGNSFYGHLGLKLKIFKRVRLSFAYNYLNFSKTINLKDGHFEDHFLGIVDTVGGKKYLYSFPWVVHDTSFRYNVNQHEAHFGVIVILPAGFKILPAFHFIHVANIMNNFTIRLRTIEDTAFHSTIDNTFRTFPFTHYDYSFYQKGTSFNNFVIALMVTKDYGIFNIGLSGSWSNLNNQTQTQAGVILTYYPLGNLDLYGTSSLTEFFQGNETRLLFSQVLGAKMTPWCWVEGLLYWGNYTNANILNGSIVYNNSDKNDYRIAATLTFLVGNHLQLSLIYQYFRNESQQRYQILTLNPITGQLNEQVQTKNNPYNTNTLIGGITWKL